MITSQARCKCHDIKNFINETKTLNIFLMLGSATCIQRCLSPVILAFDGNERVVFVYVIQKCSTKPVFPRL